MAHFLSDIVSLNERFRRSINIDSDANSIGNLEGFICPASSEAALKTIVKNISDTSESSFTWTGPFGSGKSSLALLLKGLANPDRKIQDFAKSKLSNQNRDYIQKFFCTPEGWNELSIIGSLDSPESAFKKALGVPLKTSTENTIKKCIEISQSSRSGMIVYIDEMGKFLENQSSKNSDIYFFQQLAEAANRSHGKLILIGILHQSFSEYARNLAKTTRDEWSKIQGRFIDIPINIASDEQIELIGQVIKTDRKPKKICNNAKLTAHIIAKNKRTDEAVFAERLNNTWPLHPSTAILISELSRKRFGQNQRSVFSFLMSAEPAAFKDFLSTTKEDSNITFTPDLLWEYLSTNLESTIVFSSDAKAWATAAESISKCEASNTKEKHASVLKAIAVISIFKGRSGLEPTEELIQSIFKFKTDKILQDLKKWSFILYKKHTGGYALYEGSDFSIDEALTNAYTKNAYSGNFNINNIANLKPIVAKRHYHETGTLRWLKLSFEPVSKNIEKFLFTPNIGLSEVGKVICLIPQNLDEYEYANDLMLKLKSSLIPNVVLSIANNFTEINNYTQELSALEWISDNEPSLSGDSIARREIESRITFLTKTLEKELYLSIKDTKWVYNGEDYQLKLGQISNLASSIARDLYPSSLKISNEMLNRNKPSGNANAALKALLKAMVSGTNEENLNILGYPAERGLYDSIIKNNDIHSAASNWKFSIPPKDNVELFGLWQATTKYLKKHSSKTLRISDIYENVWEQRPFGIKKGLFSPLFLAYILSMRKEVALYIEDSYQTELDDYFIDYFVGSPKDVAVKFVTKTKANNELLKKATTILNKYKNHGIELEKNASSLDVARALVKLITQLNKWVHRTKSLSRPATKLRETVNNAHDPNKLLFEDIPDLLKSCPDFSLEMLISEITEAYPKLITKLGQHILNELNVPIASKENIKHIQLRGKKLSGQTGDFRVDALASRLSIFDGTVQSISGIASLAANKPINDWIDQDIQRSLQEISSLAHHFNRSELLIKIDGTPSEREAIGILIKSSNSLEILNSEIEILSNEKDIVEALKQKFMDSLNFETTDLRLKKATVSAVMRELILEKEAC